MATQEMKWIPVSERLPEEFTEVLAYFPELRKKIARGWWLTHNDGGKVWGHDSESGHESNFPTLKFTHWMPLPEPPQ